MEDNDWQDRDKYNLSCLADNMLLNIMDEDSIPVLWEKLEKLYMGNNLINKLYLKQKLYRMKIKEGTNLLK